MSHTQKGCFSTENVSMPSRTCLFLDKGSHSQEPPHSNTTQQRQSINAATTSPAVIKKTNSDNNFDFNRNHKLQSTFLNVNCSVVGTLPETTTKVTLVITRHNRQLIQINCAVNPSHNEEKNSFFLLFYCLFLNPNLFFCFVIVTISSVVGGPLL